MRIIEEIDAIVEKFINKDERISDRECIDAIEKFLSDNKIDYAENSNYVDCGPGYEQTFYVFAWIENGKIETYEVLVESY